MTQLPNDPDELDEYYPLQDIALEAGVTYEQLRRWAEKSRNINFPEPITLGKYKLYNKSQVLSWITLWKRVNKNLGSFHFRQRSE